MKTTIASNNLDSLVTHGKRRFSRVKKISGARIYEAVSLVFFSTIKPTVSCIKSLVFADFQKIRLCSKSDQSG